MELDVKFEKPSKELNFWRKKNATKKDYIDSDEKNIEKIIANADDRSALSEELHEYAVRWPYEINLSRDRSAIARHLQIKEKDRVLEIGCGLGAVTRYLAETGAEVVGLEMSEQRARIAAQRVKGLENANIICDTIENNDLGEFDWIIMIGVMEYFNMYYNEETAKLLELHVKKKLKKNGKLIIAIENKLGTKYICGGTEEHNGIRYFGIEGRYNNKTCRTYGLEEIKKLLTQANMKVREIQYCYPDYQMPKAILTDRIYDEDIDVCDLLNFIESNENNDIKRQEIDERLLSRTLQENGILKNFANAFIAICERNNSGDTLLANEEGSEIDLGWLYNIGNKRTEYTTCTKLSINTKSNNKQIKVDKRLLRAKGGSCKGKRTLWVDNGTQEYIRGRLMSALIYEKSAKIDFNQDKLVEMLSKWTYEANAKALTTEKNITQIKQIYLDGNMVEFIPTNIIVTKDGLEYIDAEWQIKERIELGWVIWRGINSINLSLRSSINYNSLRILQTLSNKLGYSFDPTDTIRWNQMEIEFRKNVMNYNIPVREPRLDRLESPPQYTYHPYKNE